jgi:hypothetical protein
MCVCACTHLCTISACILPISCGNKHQQIYMQNMCSEADLQQMAHLSLSTSQGRQHGAKTCRREGMDDVEVEEEQSSTNTNVLR